MHVQASQGTGTGAWKRGSFFRVLNGVLGFPLAPCPRFLPSCSGSLRSAVMSLQGSTVSVRRGETSWLVSAPGEVLLL